MAEKVEKVEDDPGVIKRFSGTLGYSLVHNALKGKDTDLDFKVGPEAELIQAHSLVLKQTSVVFNVMLSDRWKSGDQIALPADDPQDFRMFLKLMYGFTGLEVEDYKDVFPVFALADKYESALVQNFLTDFADDLAKNKLTVANVVPIYLSAKEFGVKIVRDAACEFFLENINELWKDTKWLELDEEAIVWILSNDSLCHLDAQKVLKNCIRGCQGCCCATCSDPKLKPKLQYQSENEVLIFHQAVQWIKHQRTLIGCEGSGAFGNECAGAEESADVKDFAMRVLKYVRFSLMSVSDFNRAAGQVSGALTMAELQAIFLDTFFVVPESSNKFLPTAKYRKLPEVARQGYGYDRYRYNEYDCERYFDHVIEE